ncbi:MAG: UMP kinase [Sulfolobales archaeon]
MKNVVIKISGKLIDPDKRELLEKFADILRELYNRGLKILVVVGGGEKARSYINACRELTKNEGLCDLIGIEMTRVNAMLLAISLSDVAYTKIPRNFDEIFEAWATGKIVIAGGLQPGQSTIAVAASIAEVLHTDLLIYATVVEGVYDKDPSKPDARLLKEVSVRSLRELMKGSQSFVAGGYELIDPIALNIIERSKINTVIINGKDPYNIIRVINGESIGTRIVFKTT